VDQRPVSFISYNRKTAILHGQIWPTHKSDVVGLAKTGKKVLKNQVRHGYAVAHRFVQCGDVKKPRNASSSERCDFWHGTVCGLLSIDLQKMNWKSRTGFRE
jgi:hypothetical protein